MSVKLTPSQLDHAVELYLAFKSPQEIQATTGVSGSRLHRELKSRGIPPRSWRTDLDMDRIIKQYSDGASVNALSKEHRVARTTLTSRLAKAGVKLRGQSESSKVRMASMSAAERSKLAEAANRGARMRRVPEIEKFRRALTFELRGQAASPGEARIEQMLEARGYSPIAQRAIGPYNVDLAVLPVAVEVLGGGFHGFKPGHRKRTPYILDAGWHLVMVWDHEGTSALSEGAADYVVTFLEEVRRNPPATCQYRVISGSGELLSACGREDGEFPLVPPFRGRGS